MEMTQASSHAPVLAASEEEVGGALLRAFFRLAELWQLTQAEQSVLLGGLSRHTLMRWRDTVRRGEGIALSRDQRDRLSCLMGIHKALHIIYPYPDLVHGWVRRPHDDFGGRTPLAVMVEGGGLTDLLAVRTYLDDVRGGNG